MAISREEQARIVIEPVGRKEYKLDDLLAVWHHCEESAQAR
jgi:hypothetical protein